MKLNRLIIPLYFLVALVGCTTAPKSSPQPTAATQALNKAHLESIAEIKQFTIKGRIGVQAEGKGFSGGLTWSHLINGDEIALYSPLGGQVASIKRTADEVTLVDAKGNGISAKDAETLTQATLGWRLPLTGLADWSLGRPSSSEVQASIWDEQGRLSTLKQDDWQIQYQNYTEQHGYFLPSKVTLRNDKVYLKLLIENWENVSNSALSD